MVVDAVAVITLPCIALKSIPYSKQWAFVVFFLMKRETNYDCVHAAFSYF